MGKYASYFSKIDYAAMLKNRTALITGAAGQCGTEIACLFARHGARLALTDVKSKEGEELAGKIRNDGSECFFFEADLASAEETESMIHKVKSKFGKIDIMIFTAAEWAKSLVTETDSATELRVMRVNYHSHVQITKAFIPDMMEMRRGAIVAVTSNYVKDSIPGVSLFGASKAALQSFTLCMAQEYAKYNIRSNIVMPGYSIGTHGDRYIEEHGTQEAARMFEKMQPIHRRGMPEDVANAVLFLASDMAQNLLGECIPVQGGAQITGHIQLTGVEEKPFETAPRRFV